MDMEENSAKALVEHVKRIEDLIADKAEKSEAIKAEYSAAAAAGFDEDAIKAVMKRRRADARKSANLRATTEVYMRAIASFEDTELGHWAREWQGLQTTAANSVDAINAYAAATAGRGGGRSDLN